MRYFLLACCIILLPQLVHADVQITEVAWMGTAGSQYSEWIELYNDGQSSVNLAGWKLYEGDGGALVFTFTKSIPANGYLLLERTTASAPDAVPGINDESGPFGGGGFANTGEDLVLKDATGATAEELNYLGGWPAGDATSKHTMQWNGDKWITGAATPKAAAGEDTGTSTSDEPDASEEEVPEDPYPIPKVSPNKPGIAFTVPSTIYRGVSYEFDAKPLLEYNYQLNEGSIYWNMGDGTTISQRTVAPITHTYTYPGTYTISYAYSDAINKNAPLKGSKKIVVSAPAISLNILDNTALQIKNTSSTAVDLTGWKVVVPGKQLSIPDMTIVAEKATVVIPVSAFGISSIATASLVDPSGSVVARSGQDTTVVKSMSNDTETIEYDPIDAGVAADDLVAHASDAQTGESMPIRNRTKTYIFGAVALFVIGLSILLERITARQEYSEQEL